MTRMGILLSPELCIGCRGCQTACKNWNELPGTKTKNTGTVQNPPDLIPEQYNIIRYSEVPFNSGVKWLFVNRRFRKWGFNIYFKSIMRRDTVLSLKYHILPFLFFLITSFA